MDTMRELLGGLLADFDFLALNHRLANPNVFRLFQMEYVEAKHSTFLAWLLDPNAGHGLEDQFLKRFLSAALLNPPSGDSQTSAPVSPIPYDAVCERLLSWDTMDVLSADLRDTNVSTTLRRKADGGAIDIALWNDSYNIAAYIQNRILPAHVWKVRHGPPRPSRPHETEHYLLDLYAQWGTEDAGSYDILPIFLSLGDLEPSEKRCFHKVDYSWMPGFLEAVVAQVAPAAAPLINGFCDRLRLELPETLDPPLYERLVSLTKRYGKAISRMAEHVHRCTGCEDDEIAVAFHDIYRRHRSVIDFLAGFVDSLPDDRIAKIADLVGAGIDEKKSIIETGPASLSVHLKQPRQDMAAHMMTVYLGLRSQTLSLVLFMDEAVGSIDCILKNVTKLAKEKDFVFFPPKRLTRNPVLIQKDYEDDFEISSTVSDVLDLVHFAQQVCNACRPHTSK